MVKGAIRAAGISSVNQGRDLKVTTIALTLNTVATTKIGGAVDFRIPFLGMKFEVGRTVTRSDTHALDITLKSPVRDKTHEIRDADVQQSLVDAISTIRNVVTSAAEGDDPFLLESGNVSLIFAVTRNGKITLGFNGELTDQVTHTLRMTLGTPD